MLYSYFADRRLYLIKKYRNTKRVFYISTLQIHSSFFTCCQGLSCLRRCTSVLHQSTAKTDSQHQTHKTQIQIQIQLYRNTKIQKKPSSEHRKIDVTTPSTQNPNTNPDTNKCRNTEVQKHRKTQYQSTANLQQNF